MFTKLLPFKPRATTTATATVIGTAPATATATARGHYRCYCYCYCRSYCLRSPGATATATAIALQVDSRTSASQKPAWLLAASTPETARGPSGRPTCTPLLGILRSPLTEGYRNKNEMTIGRNPAGGVEVGFLLGSTAVSDPVCVCVWCVCGGEIPAALCPPITSMVLPPSSSIAATTVPPVVLCMPPRSPPAPAMEGKEPPKPKTPKP